MSPEERQGKGQQCPAPVPMHNHPYALGLLWQSYFSQLWKPWCPRLSVNRFRPERIFSLVHDGALCLHTEDAGAQGDRSNIGLHSYLQGLHFMLHPPLQGPTFKSYLFENADKHFNQSNSRSLGRTCWNLSLVATTHAVTEKGVKTVAVWGMLASGSGDNIQEVTVCSHLRGRVPPCVSRRHHKNSVGRVGMSQELGDHGSATDMQVPRSCLLSWK